MPWIGAAIGAGASLIGAGMQSNSAGEAARAQAEATAAAIAEQRRQYDQTRTDQAPWRTAGVESVNKLRYLLGLNSGQTEGTPGTAGRWADYVADGGAVADPSSPDWIPGTPGTPGQNLGSASDPEFGSLNRKFTLADFWDDPVTKASYQMGLDQGVKGINNMAGARGGRNSGATLKALTRFGTDYTGGQAAGSQARYVNDQTNTYNRYAGLSGTGQVATQATSAAGQNAANTISGLTSSLGNARGASAISSGNAWSGALGNIANNYQQQGMLDKILNSGGGYGVGSSGGNWSGGSGYNYLNPYNTSDAENYGYG